MEGQALFRHISSLGLKNKKNFDRFRKISKLSDCVDMHPFRG